MNTNEHKHTSTPWTVRPYTDEYTVQISPASNIGKVLFYAPQSMFEESLANAELIVRAVNSYEPMQARIKELEEALSISTFQLKGIYFSVYAGNSTSFEECAENAKIHGYDLPALASIDKAESILQSSKQL
jgi:hypothetical protein